MNVSGFTKAVAEMRAAQNTYFKSRLRDDLIRSKQLESNVDKALVEGIVFDLDNVTSPTATFQVENGLMDMEDGNDQ